jgi:RimJ/RimL family protein N-acetyltransferase
MADTPTLAGRHVLLEPLSLDVVDALVAAAAEDRSTFGWTNVPDGRSAMQRYVEQLLAERGAGAAVPFVQRRVADGRVIGCTRFMELRRWSGRPAPDEVEVGGTWLAASAQRTPINTEAKLRLFTHAFETWEVRRLCLCTDARNERSRAAIERAGAKFEGILRNHRPSMARGESGRARDTALFSIIDEEWPAVQDGLLRRLG